jgi:hypothetical protein
MSNCCQLTSKVPAKRARSARCAGEGTKGILACSHVNKAAS